MAMIVMGWTSRALTILGTALLLGACGSAPQEMGEMPPQETDFIQLQQGHMETEMTYPGTIEGRVNVDIKPQVSGYLDAIYVQEGDFVQKGQPLFKIRSEVFNEQVNNSAAALQSAVAAQATARLEVEKIKPLVEGAVVSDVQLRSAEANYDAAKAQVAQAKATLGSSRINAGFALIKAPVSGYIGRIPNRVGNLVTPGDAAPLTSLSDISEVFVYFSMSEAAFLKFSKSGAAQQGAGNNVGLITADGSTYPLEGRLEAGSGNIDRSTGSYSMKAVFPNPDRLLRSGGAGRVVLHHSVENAVSIPLISVKDIQDKMFVYQLLDSNKIGMVPVEIAERSGNFYVLKSGLKPGDKIAVNRIDALKDGDVVKPKLVPLESLKN